MPTFVADRYNPENDVHYPKVGDIYSDNRKIEKAQHIEGGDLMKMALSEEEPEMFGCDGLDVFNNPERPFLKYLVWYKTIKV